MAEQKQEQETIQDSEQDNSKQDPKKKENGHYIRKSLLYYRSIWGWLIFCAIIGLSRMLLMLLEPQVVSLMVDRVITPALGGEPAENASILAFLIADIPADELWHIMGVLSTAFVGFLLIYFVTFYLRWNLIHYVSLGVENRMRTQALNKINRMGTQILRKYTSGELISITNRDTTAVKDLFIAVLPFMLDNLVYLVLAAFFLARTSPLLLIGPLITFTFYAFITKGFIKKSNEYYENMWKQNSKLNTEAQESIYGIRTIKAYGAEPYRYKRFARRSEKIREFYVTFGRTRYRYFAFYGMMDRVLEIVSMIIGIALAANAKMTSGEYSAFLGYTLMMAESFVDISFLLGDVQESKVSAKRVFTFLELPDPAEGRFGTAAVSDKPDISFCDVSVCADGQTLLSHVTVDIPYGKKLGVMGRTGSGKSVFLKTMQGFTEYTDGEIRIDGGDFCSYAKTEVARAYGYAMQDVFLFSNSIAANIEYYDPKGDIDRIRECGRLAEVDEFAFDFADGYDTIIGEKGFGLSGGQKQRVAIARALYKDAPVLVLDDCTSALDLETEHAIFRNLKEACREKTLIIATHRAWALKDCDEILYFEDGRIAERGTFEELIRQDGRFAAIYRQQEEVA